MGYCEGFAGRDDCAGLISMASGPPAVHCRAVAGIKFQVAVVQPLGDLAVAEFAAGAGLGKFEFAVGESWIPVGPGARLDHLGVPAVCRGSGSWTRCGAPCAAKPHDHDGRHGENGQASEGADGHEDDMQDVFDGADDGPRDGGDDGEADQGGERDAEAGAVVVARAAGGLAHQRPPPRWEGWQVRAWTGCMVLLTWNMPRTPFPD